MMTFNTRHFVDGDYEQYLHWLTLRGRDAPRLEDLPDAGIVVFDEEDVAMGFLFESETKSCAIGNLASNPNHEHRGFGVEILIDALVELAKAKGYERMFINTNRSKLVDRLKERGFVVQEQNLTQLGKEICH